MSFNVIRGNIILAIISDIYSTFVYGSLSFTVIEIIKKRMLPAKIILSIKQKYNIQPCPIGA